MEWTDNLYLLCKTKNGTLASVELDYLNSEVDRKAVFFGSKGMIKYSLIDGEIIFVDNKGKKTVLFEDKKLDYEDMYRRQMKDFINLIKGKKEIKGNFSDGLKVMKLIHTIEKSSKRGCWQKLD